MQAEFIDPGAFRHEMALEDVALTSNGTGGHVEDWTEVATLFGRIEPLVASSRFGASQTLEVVTHRISLRHRNGIRSGMRMTRLGRTFEIVTVHDPDETGRYLICLTREQGA